MHAVCVTKPSYNNLRESDMTYIQTDCKLDYQKFIGLVSMVVVHLIASFQTISNLRKRCDSRAVERVHVARNPLTVRST